MNEKDTITISATQVATLVEEQVALLAKTLRPDYRVALEAALTREESERGRAVLEQLLANARLAKQEDLPLCQDTGYTWVCLEVNGSVCVPADVFSGVDAAVARASETAGLRMSLLHDSLVNRSNTNTNTPAFCEVLVRQGKQHDSAPSAVLHIMLKGGGSDNASSLIMLPPSAGVEGVLDL